GSALAFGLTQPILISMLVFTSLGIGLSFPYVVLAFYPGWIRFLPKPGAWMETFKQAMGFPLLAASLWLIWVLGLQTGVTSMVVELASILIMTVGLSIYGKWGSNYESSWRRQLARILTIFAIGIAIALVVKLSLAEKVNAQEEAFSSEHVQTLLQ